MENSLIESVNMLKFLVKQSRIKRNRAGKITRGIAIVCVGTDRSTGDSFGPFVGTILKQRGIDEDYGIKIIGDIDNPLHAVNLPDYIESIRKLENEYIVIGVDSSICREKNLNKVIINDSPLEPGKGVQKNLGTIGEISICGGVGCGSCALDLTCKRLSDILKMANKACDILCEFIKYRFIDRDDAIDRIEAIITSNGELVVHNNDVYLETQFIVNMLYELMRLRQKKKIYSKDITNNDMLMRVYKKVYNKDTTYTFITKHITKCLRHLKNDSDKLTTIVKELRECINKSNEIDLIDNLPFNSDLFIIQKEYIKKEWLKMCIDYETS